MTKRLWFVLLIVSYVVFDSPGAKAQTVIFEHVRLTGNFDSDNIAEFQGVARIDGQKVKSGIHQINLNEQASFAPDDTWKLFSFSNKVNVPITIKLREVDFLNRPPMVSEDATPSSGVDINPRSDIRKVKVLFSDETCIVTNSSGGTIGEVGMDVRTGACVTTLRLAGNYARKGASVLVLIGNRAYTRSIYGLD